LTCPGCSRDVTLIGGLCGHCESTVSRGLADALDELDFDAEIVDVYEHEDGYFHARFDVDEEGR